MYRIDVLVEGNFNDAILNDVSDMVKKYTNVVNYVRADAIDAIDANGGSAGASPGESGGTGFITTAMRTSQKGKGKQAK